MLHIVSLIISILVLLVLAKYRPKHIFWDNQPVMRTYSDTFGKIADIPRFQFNIDKKHDLAISMLDRKESELAYKLIYDHFSPYFKINSSFFEYNIGLLDSINICLKHSNTIVGFIHGRPIDIIYKNYKTNFIYVDYLCVTSGFRNQDAATLLISSMLNANSKSQSYIFKIDSSRLPFLPIFSSNYYYKLIESYKNLDKDLKKPISLFKDMEKIEQTTIINTINRSLQKYSLYKLYSLEEIDKYSIYVLGNSDLVIIGKPGNYTIFGQCYKSFDIDYIIGDSYKNFYIFENDMVKNGFGLLTIPYIANNIPIIKDYNFKKANKYSYYLYNYTMPKLEKKEFMFNIN